MHRTRDRLLLALAVAALAAVLIPPVATQAARYVWVEAVQFSIMALVFPALFVISAPWHVIGLGRFTERIAERRRQRNPETAITDAVAATGWVSRLGSDRLRVSVAVLIAIGLEIAWRTPPAVNRLASDRWLGFVEAGTLIAAGVAVWLELVESRPLRVRAARPIRIAVAAVSMWAVWVLGYLLGLAHSDWYRAYAHSAGHGISPAADQQLAAWVMWIVPACAFIPVKFTNLIEWLRSEDRRGPSL